MLPFILSLQTEEEKDVAMFLWNTYKDKMYKIAYGILKNREDAEDAVSDTFCRIFDHIDKFYGENATNVKSLVMIYTRGTCLNNYKKIKTTNDNTFSLYNEEGEVFDIAEPENTSTIIENKENTEMVKELLNKMDYKYRDILVLKYYYNMKDSEIATALNISISNVDVRIHRAKKMLSQLITNERYENSLIKDGDER